MSMVSFVQQEAVGFLTIDNPPLNLLTRKLMVDLDRAIEAAAHAPVRAVVLRAAGRHFGAGADAGDLFDGVSSQEARPMLARWRATARALETFPVPVIAEVQGMCVGGGLELALHCDLIVAADSAKFASLEANLGTVTLLGGAQRIAERIGPARARQFVYLAELHSAEACREWGLVNRVVSEDALSDTAFEWARKLANGPTRSHAVTKRLIRSYLDGGVSAADAVVLDLAPDIYDSADMRQGVQVLLEHGAKNLQELTTFIGR